MKTNPTHHRDNPPATRPEPDTVAEVLAVLLRERAAALVVLADRLQGYQATAALTPSRMLMLSGPLVVALEDGEDKAHRLARFLPSEAVGGP